MPYRKIIIFVFFVLFSDKVFCSDEIQFQKSNWKEIIELAQSQNKNIYLYAETTWCHWCKEMKKTLADPKVVNFVNANFISVMIDAEEMEMGRKLAMKYKITGFPSNLIFDKYGSLVYRKSGYPKPDRFIKYLTASLDPDQQFKSDYVSNNLDLPYPEFYKKAFLPRGLKETPSDSTVNSYLETQSDLLSEVNWGIIYKFTTNERINDIFLNHYDKYVEYYGMEEAKQKLFKIISSHYQLAKANHDEKELNIIIGLVEKYLDDKYLSKLYYYCLYYFDTNDVDKLTHYLNMLLSDPGFENIIGSYDINRYTQHIYYQSENPENLKKAAAWMKICSNKYSDYDFLKLQSQLLLKAKKNTKSSKQQKKE